MEPLVCPQYCNIAPVTLHSYNAPEKPAYSSLPLEPLSLPREKDFNIKEHMHPNSEGNTPASSVPTTPVKGRLKNF